MRIRPCKEEDAPEVGRLIASTYCTYNLSHADPQEQDRLLGPFCHAFSDDPKHQEAIRSVVRAPMLYVAEATGQIVGVLRGRANVLASLFVVGEHHGKGFGRTLVERSECDSREQGIEWIRVAATIFAVPFYQKLGYRKTTGIRRCHSFEGTDLHENHEGCPAL